MRYFHFIVHTPFVGEDAVVFIEAEDKDSAIVAAAEAANENGMEWFDESDWLERWCDDDGEEMTEIEYENAIGEYYAQCGYHLVKEITKFDYNLAIMEGEWCI